MIKSGVIFALVALVLGAGITLLSPVCLPCAAIFLGFAAGYVANVFDKPREQGKAVKAGTLAGVLGGIGSLIGQVVGQGINSLMIGPQGMAEIYRQLGIQTSIDLSTTYWLGQIGIGCCVGVFVIGLMAGLGALGGVVWWSVAGQKAAANQPQPEYLDVPPYTPPA